MKSLVVLSGAAMLAGLAVLEGPTAIGSVAGAYPSDAAHWQALATCTKDDPNFIRFSEDDRARCYARVFARANPVDLRIVAERGHQPRADVVTQQQNTAYFEARRVLQ